jgi:ribosome biogenesis GTPase / thiamine phosphate phosphatase
VADLAPVGWSADWEAAFAAFGAQGLVPGRVALEHNHVYRVLTGDGERMAEAAGRLKFRAGGRHDLPAVGDWVALRPGPPDGRWRIEGIVPRRSRFSRRAAGRGTHEQVVAANVDTVLLVYGLDTPVKGRSIERYLVLVRRSGARPVVVLNKADACGDEAAARAAAIGAAGDVPVHVVSARTGRGVDELRHYLVPGETLALLGPSGAGKSSLVNQLAGRDVLPTGAVRAWDARGRHTSVHRQLLVLEHGGIIVDTPGMREIQLWEADEAVDEAFSDVTALAAHCRFRDCRHDREPGCAVKAAVEAGQLDARRYANFVKLQRERETFDLQREERDRLDARGQTQAKTPPPPGRRGPTRRR